MTPRGPVRPRITPSTFPGAVSSHPHLDPFQMVQAQWGVAGVEKVPDPGPSAKLSGGPSASRPGTRRDSYTGQAPAKEKRGEASVFPGEEKKEGTAGEPQQIGYGAPLPAWRKLACRPGVECDVAPATGKPARVCGLGLRRAHAHACP